jgi:tryptophan synthase alpha chain
MLAERLATKGCHLMAFFTAGDGGEERTVALARAAVAHGADILELGIPFSDPIADGPVIQAASQRALKAGMTPGRALALAGRLRQELEVPVVLLTYMNPFLRLGVDAVARSGVEAVVIPDLALEESGPVRQALEERGIPLVAFVAPTTPEARMAEIGRVARGFVYLVSVTGVTGARRNVAAEALETLARARRHITVPLAVGFGIAGPEDARALATAADALIVGSALAEAAEAGGEAAVASLTRSLREAIDSVSLSL